MAYELTPVAEQLKQTPQMSMADMVNVGRGVQGYQSGQIALEQQDVANKEQQAVAGAMKANPGLLMTDNRLDMDKINTIIPQLAPRTQDLYLQKYSTLHGAQTQALEAKRGFSQAIKSNIGGFTRILGEAGIEDPKAVLSMFEQLKTQYADQPDVKRYLDAAAVPFKMIPQGPHVSQMLISGAQSLLTPQEQEATFGPKTGTINLNTDIVQYNQKPRPGGLPQQLTVNTQQPLAQAQITPSQEFQDTGQTDQDGNRIMLRYRKDGAYLGAVVVKRNGAISQLGTNSEVVQPTAGPNYQEPRYPPPGQTPESGNIFRAEADAARASGTPARIALNDIDTVLKYLPSASTGQSSELIAAVQSLGGNVAGMKSEEAAAAARDIIQKTINNLALTKNAALGGRFAASLDAAQASLSSPEKNPTAIAKSMEQFRPLMQHVVNYTIGLDRAIQNSPDKQFIKPKFDQQMNDAFDPMALQLKNAFDQGGKPNLDKFVKANKINLVEQQRLLGVLEKYKDLINGVVK